MASVIYKILFEIKLLHEFFLTRTDGSVIFDKTAAGKIQFLEEECSENRLPVNTVMSFEFPSGLQRQMESFFIRILPSYSGCKVAVKVKEQRQPDGSIFYQPLVPIPANLNIFILLIRKADFDVYTNGRVKRPLLSSYFFSNNEIITAKTFPYLTNAIPAFDPGYQYEQGELISDGGIIREFHRVGIAGSWGEVAGTGFANESDRLLIGPRFSYSFTDRTGLTEADFILKDSNGTEIHRQTIENTEGLPRNISLSYIDNVPFLSLSSAFTVSDALYNLEVRGNNGYTRNHTILFHEELSAANPWAVVHVTPQSTNAAFDFLDNNGLLLTRKDPMGVETAPVKFEIPVKSRLLYWRFVHNRGKKLGISPSMANYLEQEGNALITRKPRRMARAFSKIQSAVSPTKVYVPNPVSYDLKVNKDGLLCFDVIIAKSDMFPLVP